MIQNGTTSAVGQAVIAIARIWGLRTVNVVRDRPDPAAAESVARALLAAGADFVLTETEARKLRLDERGFLSGPSAAAEGGTFGPIPAPKLGAPAHKHGCCHSLPAVTATSVAAAATSPAAFPAPPSLTAPATPPVCSLSATYSAQLRGWARRGNGGSGSRARGHAGDVRWNVYGCSTQLPS